MESALRIETRVLPGKRIEISDPELPEGAHVDVIVVVREQPQLNQKHSILAILDSLPPGPRSNKNWDQIEKEFQEERNAWER